MTKDIILVSTGCFQDYIKENINQLINLNFNVHVIVDSEFLKKLEAFKTIKVIESSSLTINFDDKSKLDKTSRDGFWHNCSKRLFLLYEYIKKNNLKNVVHLENDVLLYSKLEYKFDEKIYLTMDSNTRCIPGIIYIPSYILLKNLIINYDFSKNDMENLGIFYKNNKNNVKTFPIINNSFNSSIYNENFEEFNSIFDGAAMGQYLGGIDSFNLKGNTKGFVNETCVIKYNNYKFQWKKTKDMYAPYIEINNEFILVNNLHIHSKNLLDFRSDYPSDNNFIKKYSDINKVKKIIFLNNGGSNSGDKYSNPYFYYNFNDYEMEYTNDWNSFKKTKNNLIIFGGGGILDCNKTISDYYKSLDKNNLYIHWGSGSNTLNLEKIDWNLNNDEMNVKDDILNNFIFVGRRDYLNKYYDKHEYVPCISCKLKFLQNNYKIKRKIGIVQHSFLKQINCLNYPTINTNLDKYNISEIIQFIGESEVIITGSFHGAYWGQLMGKKVIINGNWSSKFDTLKYKLLSLSDNLEDDIQNSVIPPPDYLKECIKLNDNFYNKIKKKIEEINNNGEINNGEINNDEINNGEINNDEINNGEINNDDINNQVKKYEIEENKQMDFITGEKIQFLCDHFIGTEDDFKFNPNVYKYKNRFIYICNTDKIINNKPLIFCYTHLLSNFEDLIVVLKKLQNPFKILFHNSDGSFKKEHLILFEELPLLEFIYTQNMDVIHKKVLPLPIGLANSQWKHGNNEIYKEVFNTSIKKTKEIYFNFDKNTNKQKRNECYDSISKKNILWNDNLKYRDYLIELKKHKYSICPEGNGIDTHRFWECLYMNVIPICKKNILVEYYSKIFPIIVLNEWDELNINKLIYSDIDYNYLNFEYIKKSIFSMSRFDIVIPVGPNDEKIIEKQIKYTKKNIIGYRNIYLISFNPSINLEGCITIKEDIFPFDINTVIEYHEKLDRNGWYLQQLFKLYAGKIIPGILDRYLVIDTDTFFLKPITFLENNKCLYNYGDEYNIPYFDHMKRLDEELVKVEEDKSGICHHMIFEKKYLDELISRIEKNHNESFYKVFLKLVTEKEGSGASEYEIYFNYMLKFNPDKIKIRKLKWKNTSDLNLTNSNMDYISYHWYMR